jgi:hypothetical protein
LRGANPQPAGLAPAWKTPSGRRAVWLVVADADEIDGPERKFVDALIAGSAELAHLIALARETRATIRERREERLDGQLVAAEETTFAGFAGGLRRDLAAVRAALSPSCPELISLVFGRDCIKRFGKKSPVDRTLPALLTTFKRPRGDFGKQLIHVEQEIIMRSFILTVRSPNCVIISTPNSRPPSSTSQSLERGYCHVIDHDQHQMAEILSISAQ